MTYQVVWTTDLAIQYHTSNPFRIAWDAHRFADMLESYGLTVISVERV